MKNEEAYEVVVMAIDSNRKDWFALQTLRVEIRNDKVEDIKILTYGAIILSKSSFFGDKIATISGQCYSKSRNFRLSYSLVNSSFDEIIINRYSGDIFITADNSVQFKWIDITVMISLESFQSNNIFKYHSTKLILNQDDLHHLNFQQNEYIVQISECEARRGMKLIQLQALYPGNPISDLQYFINDIYCGISERKRLANVIVNLDKDTGWLNIGEEDLDREQIEASQITVEVVVIDRGKNVSRLRSTKVFINILDCNDNIPVFYNETFIFHVPENTTIGEKLMVGTVLAEDKDLDSVLKYTLERSDSSLFHLNKDSGTITSSGVPFDYEHKTYFTMKVKVSDGVFSTTADVLIIVRDVNDECHEFTETQYHFYIKENAPIHTILGQVLVRKADIKNESKIRFTIISDWGRNLFAVHPHYGIITTSGTIDYEKETHYILLITASDINDQPLLLPCSETVTTTVLISVADVNDNIPIFDHNESHVSIQENASIGTFIHKFTASDMDRRDLLQFEIASPNDNLFGINPLTGAIFTAGSLDYEKTENYLVTVTCSDGTHFAVAKLEINIININDEAPNIYNHPLTPLSTETESDFLYIKCKDKDHLGTLSYDIDVSSLTIMSASVDKITGKIVFNSDILRQSPANMTLICSDGLHKSRKNIEIFLKDDNINFQLVSVNISVKVHNASSVWEIKNLVSKVLLAKEKYNFFLTAAQDQLTNRDFNFYEINSTSGDFRQIYEFFPRKLLYQFYIVAISEKETNGNDLKIAVSMKYHYIESCYPRYIGTPYSFQIQTPVEVSRLVGSVAIGYCSNHTINYYLNSGQSYFHVNNTNGKLYVKNSPPLGPFRLKLTSIINTHPKKLLSTIITFISTELFPKPIMCTFSKQRIRINSTSEIGTVVSRVSIKDPSTNIQKLSFKMSQDWPLSVLKNGDLVLQTKPAYIDGNPLELSVEVNWWYENGFNSQNCPIQIVVTPVREHCALHLVYPGSFLEIYTFRETSPGLFLFGIPISFQQCKFYIHDLLFFLSNPNFNINKYTGAISSQTTLYESKYEFSINVYSDEIRKDMKVPIRLLVLDKLQGVDIIFETNHTLIKLSTSTPIGTMIGSMKAKVNPSHYQNMVKYSLVHFCCIYPTNIAVYNNSIYQSFFHISPLNGHITVSIDLPKMNHVFILRIRASLTNVQSNTLVYADKEIQISVMDILCRCNYDGFFSGNIEENANPGTVIVKNVLKCNENNGMDFQIFPVMIHDLVHYDRITNEIKSARVPFDREKTEHIEMGIHIKDRMGNTIDTCIGIINVIDINDNPPRFTLNYFMGSILEDAPIGTWILDIGVIDEDSKAYHLKFNLLGDEAKMFRINPQNGSVYLFQSIDREQTSRYEMKVSVSDGVHVLETGMLIIVTDVNDNNPIISSEFHNRTFVISSSDFVNGPVFVTKISAFDHDDPLTNNSKVQFSLSSDTSKMPFQSLFHLNEDSGSLFIVPEILNWVTVNETVDVFIKATDKGNPRLSHSLLIQFFFISPEWELRISNQTHQEPNAILYTVSKGSNVLQLTIENGEYFHNISYKTLNGNGTGFFSIDTVTGQMITERSMNSTAIGTWLSLNVQACGYRKRLSYMFCSKKQTMVFVTSGHNVHSPKMRFSQMTVRISENAQVAHRLLQFKVADLDTGIAGVVKVKIVQPSTGEFSLLSSNGALYYLTLSSLLDYEKQQKYVITILGYDLGSPRKSRKANVLINVIDEDDNFPYFTRNNFVYKVFHENQFIALPRPVDDDLEVRLTEFQYNLTTDFPTHVQLYKWKYNASLKVNSLSWKRSVINVKLQIVDAKSRNPFLSNGISSPGRYDTINIYLVLSNNKWNLQPCSYEQIREKDPMTLVPSNTYPEKVKHRFVYHLLTAPHWPSKQNVLLNAFSGHLTLPTDMPEGGVIVSVSDSVSLTNEYQMCLISPIIKPAGSNQHFHLLANNIAITKNVKSGEVVGKISIFPAGNFHLFTFRYRIYCDHYLPFYINDSGNIISEDNIYCIYPAIYNIKVRVKSSLRSIDNLEAKFSIYIQLDLLRNNKFPISLNVRENIGVGAILGSVRYFLNHSLLDMGTLKLHKEFLENHGRVLVDRQGLIQVKSPIDRETTGTLRIPISVQFYNGSATTDLIITVNDENDCKSKSRRATIFFSVYENFLPLNKLVRLIPNDNDTVGNYKCRLDTLEVPLGIMVTSNCWLHVLNHSSISHWNNNSIIRVFHHDGKHNAVLSTYRLAASFVKEQIAKHNYVILKFPKFPLRSLIGKLKQMKRLLSSFNVPVASIALDPLNYLVVVWPFFTNNVHLKELMEQHKHQLELILDQNIVAILIDLCDSKSCYQNGICSTSYAINRETNVFSDDVGNTVDEEINIYSSITMEMKCLCKDGYVGKQCNLFSRCSQHICYNGGICGIKENHQVTCVCLPGYTGLNCDQDVNECDKTDICSSHGNCVNNIGGFKCECQMDWIGNSFCTQPMDHCLTNPCSISGTEQCVPILGGYKCRCKFGNFGDKCQYLAISLKPESFLEMELSSFSQVSLELSTINKDSPIMTIVLSSSIIIQISLSMGSLLFTLFEDFVSSSQHKMENDISNGKWWKLELSVHFQSMVLSAMPCGDLNTCDATNDIYSNGAHRRHSLTLKFEKINLPHALRIIIGSNENIKLPGPKYFLGCIRNLQMINATVIRKEEKNLLYDSCPRYKTGSTPCSNPVLTCGRVGKCIDEWFIPRCECPTGYQPPFCSAGLSAYSLAQNTIVSFVRRPESISIKNKRKKRSLRQDNNTVSLRIKTGDANSILLMALSSFHSYTIVQLEDGFIKVVDKYAGSSQEMLHKAVAVNDNKIHVVTITRYSTGTVSVTVDFVVAQVNWLQSHDIIGQSVHTLYLAGIPQNQKLENSITIPNFSGCLSDIRFNNQTMPLDGLTGDFNVSILQGSIATGCSSGVCLQSGLCEKYQKCEEVSGVPHGIWGQYKCVDNKQHRLLSILLPILISSLLCILLISFIFIFMKQRRNRLKGKNSIDHLEVDRAQLKKRTPKTEKRTNESTDLIISKKSGKTPRSATSSTLLMQEFEKGNATHPDVIRSHEVMFEPDRSGLKSNFESLYYHDATILNPYLLSGNMTVQREYGSKQNQLPRNIEPFNGKPLKKFNYSTGALKQPDDSLVYHCSHPDEYEPVGSNLSSNTSQDRLDQPKFPFAYQFQTQGLRHEYFHPKPQTSDVIVPRNCDIRQSSSSSSNNSHFLTQKAAPHRRMPFPNTKIDDIFSNTDSNLTSSPKAAMSLESLSSSINSQNVFTPTDSSDSIPSNKNSIIPNTGNCWKNIQRALPPPPPPEDQYEYADIKTN